MSHTTAGIEVGLTKLIQPKKGEKYKKRKRKIKIKIKIKIKTKLKEERRRKKRSSLRPCPRRATNLVTEVGVHSRSIQGKRFPLAVLVLKGEEMKSLD